ncbi:MAG: transglutaminase domain-containing protein, partial [Acidimicrobiaceae bacterium]|nr:transglutaminase domain-containing protein [Acidimicrobiaceae bacterium]
SPSVGAGKAFSQGLGSLVNGWSRVLTTSVPVPPTVDRLPLLAAIVGLAAALAALAASGARRNLLGLLPAALTLLGALLLGVDGPGSVVQVAAPPAAVAALYLLTVSRPSEGAAWVPPSRLAAATVTGAVVLVVMLAVGTNLPLATLRQPVNLRSSLSPPVDLGDTPNPLVLLPARQAAPTAVMFTAKVDQAWIADPEPWRLASLDVYTGVGWSSDARAVRAGNVLDGTSGLDATALGPTWHQTITARALSGPWVPTTGAPTGVTPSDLAFDPATWTLIAAPNVDGRSFGLSGRPVVPTRALLDVAGVGPAARNPVLTALPSCLPASLRTMATHAVAGLVRPDQEAVAIERALASGGGFTNNPAGQPGSSCGRLAEFARSKQGTPEQFATAFALMARSVGLPARVVVGFQTGDIDAQSATVTVHGSDATVWPEVQFSGVGWVQFDPVPTAGGASGASGPGPGPAQSVPRGQEALNQVRQTVDNHAAQTVPKGPAEPGTTTARPHPSGSGTWWWLALPGGIAALFGGWVAARLVARRRRRTRRRKAVGPIPQIMGAWAESLDALAAHTVKTASLTPTESAALAAQLAPPAGNPARLVAERVDRAVYGGLAEDGDARIAWKASDEAVQALRKALSGRQRLVFLLTGGRSLLPTRRRRPSVDRGGAPDDLAGPVRSPQEPAGLR